MLRMSGTRMKNGIAMKSASSKWDLHGQELGLRKKVRREDLEANFRVSNKIFALFFLLSLMYVKRATIITERSEAKWNFKVNVVFC